MSLCEICERPDFEFYETPVAFTKWLVREVDIQGRVLEPCVGDGAIPRAADPPEVETGRQWISNDLDPRWRANFHLDAARQAALWATVGNIDWTVSNPPFTSAIEIIEWALATSNVGVAMHLRASIHEVLKTGRRRTWMARHQPTGILWLPRCAYQRSKTTREWTTDSMCACWVIWLSDPAAPQFIRYAPEWVIDRLAQETPAYRARMDDLMARLGAPIESHTSTLLGEMDS